VAVDMKENSRVVGLKRRCSFLVGLDGNILCEDLCCLGILGDEWLVSLEMLSNRETELGFIRCVEESARMIQQSPE